MHLCAYIFMSVYIYLGLIYVCIYFALRLKTSMYDYSYSYYRYIHIIDIHIHYSYVHISSVQYNQVIEMVKKLGKKLQLILYASHFMTLQLFSSYFPPKGNVAHERKKI